MNKLDIYNQALGLMGKNSFIQDINDTSNVLVKTLNVYYDQCLDEALKNVEWDFAKRTVALTLFGSYSGSEYNPDGDNQLSESGWSYTYYYPNNCVEAIFIRPDDSEVYSTGSDNTNVFRNIARSNVPFTQSVTYNSLGETIRVISTDKDKAELTYISKITDTSLFSSDFISLLTLLLASKSSMAILENPQKAKMLLDQSVLYMNQLKKTYSKKSSKDLKPYVIRRASNILAKRRWGV